MAFDASHDEAKELFEALVATGKLCLLLPGKDADATTTLYRVQFDQRSELIGTVVASGSAPMGQRNLLLPSVQRACSFRWAERPTEAEHAQLWFALSRYLVDRPQAQERSDDFASQIAASHSVDGHKIALGFDGKSLRNAAAICRAVPDAKVVVMQWNQWTALFQRCAVLIRELSDRVLVVDTGALQRNAKKGFQGFILSQGGSLLHTALRGFLHTCDGADALARIGALFPDGCGDVPDRVDKVMAALLNLGDAYIARAYRNTKHPFPKSPDYEIRRRYHHKRVEALLVQRTTPLGTKVTSKENKWKKLFMQCLCVLSGTFCSKATGSAHGEAQTSESQGSCLKLFCAVRFLLSFGNATECTAD